MKKYHVGYVQGTFDMFHVGHLNLLRKAKEYCEQLYVGVVSDEYSKMMKGMYPCICVNDRISILEAIVYVDRVFKVDYTNDSIVGIWKMIKFECLFSGDDHISASFVGELNSLGVDTIFFPYTKSISSTEIREKMRKRILYGWAEDYPFEDLPSRIALYGAGKFGKALYEKIYSNTRIDIVCWVDKNAKYVNCNNVNIELPDRLLKNDYEMVVIAVKRHDLAASIRTELLALNIPDKKIMWVDLYENI